MLPNNVFHQQIPGQSAAGVSGIIHFTDGEMETLGRGAACLRLHHSPAAEQGMGCNPLQCLTYHRTLHSLLDLLPAILASQNKAVVE